MRFALFILSLIEIIPSINVPTFEEVQERIQKVEPYVTWCHLDVTDGIFSKHLTWHEPLDLPRLQTNLKVEAHLMVENPELMIDSWLVKPVSRVIVHLEAVKDFKFIIRKCIEAEIEVGLAINPETFWGLLTPWLERIEMAEILAVRPGPSGQKMSDDIVDKIKHLREFNRDCIIEVDGGINAETAKLVKQAGADLLVASSAIFESDNIEQAIYKLKQAII